MNNFLMALLSLLLTASCFGISEKDYTNVFKATVLPWINKSVTVGKAGDLSFQKYEVIGSDRVLVIFPGRTEPAVKYYELIYDLKDIGMSIYVVDQLGQGFSKRYLDNPERGYIDSYDSYVRAIEAFMKQEIASKYKDKYFLAHSMGGHIATLYAKKHPNQFQTMILSAPMFGVKTGVLPKSVARVLVKLLTMIGLGEMYAPGTGGYDAEKRFEGNDVTGSALRFNMKMVLSELYPKTRIGGPTVKWVYETFKSNDVIINDVEKIESEVVIFQATNDQIVENDAQNRVCSKMKRCRIVKLEGSEHEILMERDIIRAQALKELGHLLNQ